MQLDLVVFIILSLQTWPIDLKDTFLTNIFFYKIQNILGQATDVLYQIANYLLKIGYNYTVNR